MLLPSCYPGSALEHEGRIWFAAPQRRDLREMKTRPCALGKINAPPRLTSQKISPAPFRLSLRRGQSFKSTDWKKKKRRNIELGSGFGRFLAAKIEFSYGAGQTLNLLALRLQWFESTPTQASSVLWLYSRSCERNATRGNNTWKTKALVAYGEATERL